MQTSPPNQSPTSRISSNLPILQLPQAQTRATPVNSSDPPPIPPIPSILPIPRSLMQKLPRTSTPQHLNPCPLSNVQTSPTLPVLNSQNSLKISNSPTPQAQTLPTPVNSSNPPKSINPLNTSPSLVP